ncbi:hypothetical protein ATCC90586_012093 [Pythium insidiosum]|nr:hypothetical protein ATCC90586_012093 [Pythium insidiosum]
MKIAAVVATASLLLTAAFAHRSAPECNTTGQSCKDAKGKPSRCLIYDEETSSGKSKEFVVCLDAPLACKTGAKPLDPCVTHNKEAGLCGFYNDSDDKLYCRTGRCARCST